MLTEKDKEFIANVDISKFTKTEDRFWVLWAKVRNYVVMNYETGKVNKIDEILKACQIRLGKEELARRNNK